ncbi:hypothetical protein OXI21_02025 [Ignatzschineria sp. RMDPL8A]|uniref:alpha/beta hydrolase n=1 Tax=Ignatzschineria sp. RMDPL8A TaxID=2999236 RepID=UPI0024466424|nr:hypothetical protein [Ignatzschineria sp. RMDPL8A]MDG9729196.1 hypothetical protein [Ignatzschineria sp. RMDPL8A]
MNRNYLTATVSVPLLKGHGTEPADLIGVSYRDWIRQMEEALEQLQKKCSRVFVVGLSMGATKCTQHKKSRPISRAAEYHEPLMLR